MPPERFSAFTLSPFRQGKPGSVNPAGLTVRICCSTTASASLWGGTRRRTHPASMAEVASARPSGVPTPFSLVIDRAETRELEQESRDAPEGNCKDHLPAVRRARPELNQAEGGADRQHQEVRNQPVHTVHSRSVTRLRKRRQPGGRGTTRHRAAPRVAGRDTVTGSRRGTPRVSQSAQTVGYQCRTSESFSLCSRQASSERGLVEEPRAGGAPPRRP